MLYTNGAFRLQARNSILEILQSRQNGMALGRPTASILSCSHSSRQLLQPLPGAATGINGHGNSSSGRRCMAAASKKSAAAVLSPPIAERIEDRELHVEASESYLAYAMSVIVGRALPDVRDGLKPVHRRILYAMHELGLAPNKPFKKCARVVGEVLGKYHPHGDQAVYDALVRLAQTFSMRDPLIAGHGNFGSLDDDPAAAMRYTECKLQPLASDMLLADLDSETVDFIPTFDASQVEPVVLPSKIPHLLVNGTNGIAVGIATKIPPHNMREVVAALSALIRKPDITNKELIQYIPAPDFPTGGEIAVGQGMVDAYETGHGHCILRAKVIIEDGRDASEALGSTSSGEASTSGRKNSPAPKRGSAAKTTGSGDKPLLVITEVPFQTSKAELVEKIAELVESKTIEGVADVRDESDREGLRLVVEVRRGFSADVVLAQLYKHTRLEAKFSCNMVALVNNVPRSLSLRDFLKHFLDFRCEVVERRAKFQLSKAQQREHQVRGYLIAMARLDDVVEIIRSAKDGPAAKAALVKQLGLSEEQAEAVLGLPLRRLTAMEKSSLEKELGELTSRISDLKDLLGKRERVLSVVEKEAKELAAKYGTPRRSKLIGEVKEVDVQQLLPDREVLLMSSRKGYVRRMLAEEFQQQARGGKGTGKAGLRNEDALEQVVPAMERDPVLLFTTTGKAYLLRAHQVPEPTKSGYGMAVAQVLGTASNVPMVSMVPIPMPEADPSSSSTGGGSGSGSSQAHRQQQRYLIMLTQNGTVKKTELTDKYLKISKGGLQVAKDDPADPLQWVCCCTDHDFILMASSNGKMLVFSAAELRSASRASGGVKAMKVPAGHRVVSMFIIPAELAAHMQQQPEAASDSEDIELSGDGEEPSAGPFEEDVSEQSSPAQDQVQGPWVLLVSKRGLGKRTPMANLKLQRRNCVGLVGASLKKQDELAAVRVVHAGDEVVFGSALGKIVRISADGIRVLRRATKGVKLMDLAEGDAIQTVAVIPGKP